MFVTVCLTSPADKEPAHLPREVPLGSTTQTEHPPRNSLLTAMCLPLLRQTGQSLTAEEEGTHWKERGDVAVLQAQTLFAHTKMLKKAQEIG